MEEDTNLNNYPPFSPSTAWSEVIEDDEQTLFEDFAGFIGGMQEKYKPENDGQVLRGLHAKIHAGFLAEFRVLDNLHEYARVGIFSEPRIFPAIVRFSNGKPILQADKKPEPRGMAIKLIGVPGKKLLSGKEDAVTQDFLATSHSVTSAVRNIRQFIAFIKAEQKGYLTLPINLAREVGIGEAARILSALTHTVILSHVNSMATERYEGTAPIKFGDYAVKFTIAPAAGTKPAEGHPDQNDSNFLRDELNKRLQQDDLFFDFLVQFFVDETKTPIEDTSIPWSPDDTPYLKVAEIRIPRCEPDQQLTEKINQLSFTPWHTTDDHRPLGNVMRARKVAYQASSALRESSPEPTGLPL